MHSPSKASSTENLLLASGGNASINGAMDSSPLHKFYQPTLYLAQTEAPAPMPAAPGVPAQPGAPGQPAPPQPGLADMLMPLLFMFAIFYFLLIRPQQKKQKEHQKLIGSVKSGDRIVTNAGIHGLVTNVKDATVLVKVADNVKIEFDKGAIASVTKGTEEAA